MSCGNDLIIRTPLPTTLDEHDVDRLLGSRREDMHVVQMPVTFFRNSISALFQKRAQWTRQPHFGFNHAEIPMIKGQSIFDQLPRLAGYDQCLAARIEHQALNSFS